MKIAKWPVFLGLILGMVSINAFAQNEQALSERQKLDAQRQEAMVLVGQELRDSQGEEIGEVDNVIVTPDGKLYAVLSVGGFFGIGDERVLVPFEKLQTTQNDYVVYPGTEEELEALPTYREGRSRQYISRNYRMIDREGQEVALNRSGMPQQSGVAAKEQKDGGVAENETVNQASYDGNRMISTLTFPAPEGRGSIVVEREGLQQVRVGESYDYTLQITNDSKYPVMDVTIKEMLSDNIAVEGSKVAAGKKSQDTKKGTAQKAEQATSQNNAGQQSQAQKQTEQQMNRKGDAQKTGQVASQNSTGQQSQSQKDTDRQMHQGEKQWTIARLMPGESKKIEVSGTAQKVGDANSCLVVDFKPSLCNEFQVVKPELEFERNIVDSEGNPVDRAFACDEVYFVYRLTNAGTGTTDKATIKEELPEQFKSGNGEKGVELTVEKLEQGKSAESRVAISADSAARYEGRATATSGQMKAKSNSGSIVIMKPELDVSIDGPSEEFLGRPLQYHIRVENTSDAPALDTVVTMEAGTNLHNMSVSRQKMKREGNQFMIGELKAGESREFTVSFDAEEPGEITNSVTAKAYCAQEKSEKVTTKVAGIPAVRLEVIDRSDPVKVGETTTYEISVKNQGSAEDLNVTLNGKLPQEMEFVSGEGDTKVTGNGQQVQFTSIDALAPGEMMSWNVKAKAKKAGKTKFQLELKSDANPKPVIEMEPTTLF